ncbi:MAG: hypothetical protein KA028_01830 [Candidatus Pacebacteria bacterium]|nr:hypothetical protein [Candidatus Paceibacterota bacterium]MBP9851813.1 hypothetical protein [Candidatus Paceibacterota bacterium]
MKKIKHILLILSGALIFVACGTKPPSGAPVAAGSSGGGKKTGLVDFTRAYVDDPKYPWNLQARRGFQYFLKGNIILYYRDTVPEQFIDEEGSPTINETIQPLEFKVKDGTELTLDTIVGDTWWFKVDEGGTWRWISFTEFTDGWYHFYSNAMTVNLDGAPYMWMPASQGARIQFKPKKNVDRKKLIKYEAQGSKVVGRMGDGSASGGGNGGGKTAPNSVGADPFGRSQNQVQPPNLPMPPAQTQPQQTQPQQTQPQLTQPIPGDGVRQPLFPF